jgi:glycine/D-amino acid oxidase-like deaminating enzyme
MAHLLEQTADAAAGTGSRRGLQYSIYWRQTEPVEPGPPLEGEVSCDVCIVGGGYTGLWTAHFLKLADPSLDVHVVEAEYAGAGASGHNDGFVTPTIGHGLHTVVRRFGAEQARAAYAAVGRSILELRRFCRKYEIDAELEPGGFYLVATSDAQRRRLDADVALAELMGVRYEVLEAAEAKERIDSPAVLGALKTPGALVNPHRLARGLARVVRDQGVHVHERTRASMLGRVNGRHAVTTPSGRVLADRLVLATNAYQHQWASFRRRLKPVWSYAMVSEPLSDEQLARVHWPGREGFVEARNFIVFARLTADNRLLLGGGPAPYFYGRDMSERHVRNDAIFTRLRGELERFFPAWRDLRWSHAYGGCIGVTRDLVPHVGRLDDGSFYAYGYCGNGIAMTRTAARGLCDLILERDSEHSKLAFVGRRASTFPPEPVAYAGARALSAVLAWQDRHPNAIPRQLV